MSVSVVERTSMVKAPAERDKLACPAAAVLSAAWDVARVNLAGKPLPEPYRPVACASWAKTGYEGRLALDRVVTVTEEIEQLAVGHESATDIAAVARQQRWLLEPGRLGHGRAGDLLGRGDPADVRLTHGRGRP